MAHASTRLSWCTQAGGRQHCSQRVVWEALLSKLLVSREPIDCSPLDVPKAASSKRYLGLVVLDL